MPTARPTLEQVLAIKHWHPCDLNTHTLAECSRLARHDHALEWGAEALAMAGIFAVTYVVVAPLTRAVLATRRQGGATA